MNKLKIPHNAFVFVGDGRKALFLRNDGDEKFPNLKTEKVFEDDNPPSQRTGHRAAGAHWQGIAKSQRRRADRLARY